MSQPGREYKCVLCEEMIDLLDDWVPLNPVQYAHRACSMRSVAGGIGHHIAHEYWCLRKHDPDAGLTVRQSSMMVMALIDVLGGVDALFKRGEVHDLSEM